MALRTFTILCLCLAISAFNIITPRPGEVISVDELYNLTWTTEGVPANYLVMKIEISYPDDLSILDSSDGTDLYLQGWWEYPFNISGTAGHYSINISRWWSPLFSELPHGPWVVSLELFNQAEKIPGNTVLNDTVEIELTSSIADQRPQLPPMKDFALNDGNGGIRRPSAVPGVLAVVLGVVVPVLLLAVAIWLVRYQWKHHTYSSLSHKPHVKQPEPLLLTTRDNEKRPQPSKSTIHCRIPRNFLFAAFLAIAPLFALFTALVSILLLYKVNPSKNSRADFLFNESGSDPTAFYVDYDATRYTTVASWTSSIALLVPGILTSLIWYRQTQQLESDASHAQCDKLLTPYQFSLLLNLKSGTLGSLWEYVSYIISRRREKQSRFLFDTGFVVLLSTLLGLGLWTADTWLHIVTSTVPLTTALAYTAPESRFLLKPYGRALNPNCSTVYLASIAQNYSCILERLLGDVPPSLTDAFLYASVVSGRDTHTKIMPATLGQDRVAYIAPASNPKELDYRANTFAVRSLCKNIDEWCWLPPQNASSPPTGFANCGKFVGVPVNYSAPIAYGTVGIQGVVGIVTSFFRDQDWQDVMTVNNTSNSFYTVTRLDSPIHSVGHGLPVHWLLSQSGTIYSNYIGCNTEFINLTYTYVNGSIRSADITPLNDVDLLNAIFLPVLINFDPFITGGAAATVMADDADSAIETWIDTLHKQYLSLAATATVEVDNIDQQERYTRLVARIPKAPLFTLGTLLILSIIFNGFIIIKSMWGTSLRKTHPKQLMVSIAGLAASTFDTKVTETEHAVIDLWDLFKESKEESPSTRIGIGNNSNGGYHLVTFTS